MTTVSSEPRVPMHETAAAARRARQRSVWDPAIVRRAILESFTKLDPRYMIGKPVMFIVEIGSVWVTILFFTTVASSNTADNVFDALVILVLPVTVLVFAAVSILIPSTAASVSSEGPHGLTEMVYAYTSAAHNNGSCFCGFDGNTTYYNVTLAIAMWVGRFFEIIPALALAGSLARKRTYAMTSGTVRTDKPLFTLMVIGIVLILVGLTYFPALALGPVAEHFAGHFGL